MKQLILVAFAALALTTPCFAQIDDPESCDAGIQAFYLVARGAETLAVAADEVFADAQDSAQEKIDTLSSLISQLEEFGHYGFAGQDTALQTRLDAINTTPATTAFGLGGTSADSGLDDSEDYCDGLGQQAKTDAINHYKDSKNSFDDAVAQWVIFTGLAKNVGDDAQATVDSAQQTLDDILDNY